MYMNKPSWLLVVLSLWGLEAAIQPLSGQHHEEHSMEMEGMSHHVRSPSTVMGLHSLSPGKVMINYRFGMMKMGEAHHHLGRDHVTAESVLRDYQVAPVRMRMRMQMVGAMIGLPGNLATTFMLPITSRSMDHTTAAGGKFTTESNGIGDLNIGLTTSRHLVQNANAAFGITLSVPTGTTNAKDMTPASSPNKMILPYPMQLGSGSLEIKPEASASLQLGGFDLGGKMNATLRTGKNEIGYRLGNEFSSSLWIALEPVTSTQTSLALDYNSWGNISGSDPRLQQSLKMVPTADPKLRSGRELLLTPEVIVSKNTSRLGSHGFVLSGTIPLWHSLEGPQLGLAWSLNLGWRLSTN